MYMFFTCGKFISLLPEKKNISVDSPVISTLSIACMKKLMYYLISKKPGTMGIQVILYL